MTRAGNPKREEDGIPIIQKVLYEKGGVRDDFVKALMLDGSSTPQEWFRAFLPEIPFCYAGGKRSKVKRPPLIADWCSFTNLKATLCNTGQRGYAYPDWTPFTVKEIERHVGLYFFEQAFSFAATRDKILYSKQRSCQWQRSLQSSIRRLERAARLQNVQSFFLSERSKEGSSKAVRQSKLQDWTAHETHAVGQPGSVGPWTRPSN
jgi:hypothetical protein